MIDNLEDLSCLRLRALESIKANKPRVAKYYNKKVKIKQFSEGDLVWKVKLLIGSKDSKFSKWSPNWKDLIGSNIVRLTTLIFWKH